MLYYKSYITNVLHIHLTATAIPFGKTGTPNANAPLGGVSRSPSHGRIETAAASSEPKR